MDPTTLSGRLRWLLTTSGLSARSVARRAGLSSPAHVGMIVRGTIEGPSIDTVEGIARAFGVSAAWLAYGQGDQPDAEALRTHAAADTTADAQPTPAAG